MSVPVKQLFSPMMSGIALVLLLFLVQARAPAGAHPLVGRIPIPAAGIVQAVINPTTNRIYVATPGALRVIDGATHAVTQVPGGLAPGSMAIDEVRNRLLVADAVDTTLTIIDAATGARTASVNLGCYPVAMAVNPVTQRVYVGCDSSRVLAVDLPTAAIVADVAVAGRLPTSLAVDVRTNRIFVAGFELGAGGLTVVDGLTHKTVLVPTGAAQPFALTFDPIRNRLFVAHFDGPVEAYDAASHARLGSISIRARTPMAIDPVRSRLYVSHDSGVAVVDTGALAIVQVPGGHVAASSFVAANLATDRAYLAGGDFYTLNGDSLALVNTASSFPAAGTLVNPVTGRIYVLEANGGEMRVYDGSRDPHTSATVSVGSNPTGIAIDPRRDKAYVANEGGNSVTIIDGRTLSTTTLAVGVGPRAAAINRSTGKVYVSNAGSGDVTVIDPSTLATVQVKVGNRPGPIAVNAFTNRIYVGNEGDSTVTVIDGATHAATALPVRQPPQSIAVNEATDKTYVLGAVQDLGAIDEIDGVSRVVAPVATLALGGGLAVDALRNRVYAVDAVRGVLRIDAATFATAVIPILSIPIFAINSLTNTLYVATVAGATVAIDADSFAATQVSPLPGIGIVVDQQADVAYAIRSNAVSALYGRIATTNSAPIGQITERVAVNPATGDVYTLSPSANTASVWRSIRRGDSPLTTKIAALPGDATASPSPTFSLTTSWESSAYAPPVRAVYYSLDTVHGPWRRATGTGPYAAATSGLAAGEHTIFAFAVDDALSNNPSTWTNLGIGASPMTGGLAAYRFTVTPRTAQSIAFAAQTSRTYQPAGTFPINPAATASSGLPVAYASNTPAVCAVAGTTVTIVSAGNCEIVASQAGDATFSPAPDAAQTVAILATVPGAPAIGTATPSNGQATVAFSPPASNGGSPITGFVVTCTPGPVAAAGTASPILVAGLANGTAYSCVVSATNAVGTGAASAAVAVTPAALPAQPQSITFGAQAPQPLAPGGAFALSPSASASSGLPVTYSSQSATVCGIAGSTVSMLSAGTCAIAADQPGDANFTAAPQVVQSIAITAVVPGAPTLSSATAGNRRATIAFAAPAFDGGSPITGYWVACSHGTGAAGAASPLTVTGMTNGFTYECTVTATNAIGAGAASAPAVVTPSSAIGLAQAISFDAQAARNFVAGEAFELAPLAIASSGLAVAYSSLTPTVCRITGSTVTTLAFGVCTIAADQHGDAVYQAAARVSQSILLVSRSFSSPTATGTGIATASFTGGGATCGFSYARFIGAPPGAFPVPPTAPPSGTAFPHGLLDFATTGCTPGSTVAITVIFPSGLAPDTSYWKYGPTPSNPAPNWYVVPAAISGAGVTFAVADGGLGDDDLIANGTIVDQGGPGVPAGGGAAPVPTLSEWGSALLALLLLATAAGTLRPQAAARPRTFR